MRYFDTSFLIPLVLVESTSESIRTFFIEADADDLAVSDWTLVEFASMLAREVRMGGLQADAAQNAIARFESLVQTSFEVLLPTRDDFVRARYWLGLFDTSLKAPDALHLAIAGNRNATSIYTLDRAMIVAGRTLGLPTGAGSVAGFD